MEIGGITNSFQNLALFKLQLKITRSKRPQKKASAYAKPTMVRQKTVRTLDARHEQHVFACAIQTSNQNHP